MPSVLQSWVQDLPYMQQSVLLGAIRGPDGRSKYGAPKMLLRWYRRCVLISALDGEVLKTPFDPRGGSFTGPSITDPFGTTGSLLKIMSYPVEEYLKVLDAIPAHFQNHFREAIAILGYKHPDPQIKQFWQYVNQILCQELNLLPETLERMEKRLGDNKADWQAATNSATRS